MPEYMQKTMGGVPTGETDWSKIFMGFAMALVFVMQQYHSMQLADVRAEVVPRAEYEKKHEKLMQKDEILTALKLLTERINTIDKKVDNKISK